MTNVKEYIDEERMHRLGSQGWFVPGHGRLPRASERNGRTPPDPFLPDFQFHKDAVALERITDHPVCLTLKGETIQTLQGPVTLTLPDDHPVIAGLGDGNGNILLSLARYHRNFLPPTHRHTTPSFIVLDRIPGVQHPTSPPKFVQDLPDNVFLAAHTIGIEDEPLPEGLEGNIDIAYFHNLADLLWYQSEEKTYKQFCISPDSIAHDLRRLMKPNGLLFFGHSVQNTSYPDYNEQTWLKNTTEPKYILWFAHILAASGLFRVFSVAPGANPHLDERRLMPTNVAAWPLFAQALATSS